MTSRLAFNLSDEYNKTTINKNKLRKKGKGNDNNNELMFGGGMYNNFTMPQSITNKNDAVKEFMKSFGLHKPGLNAPDYPPYSANELFISLELFSPAPL